MTTLTYPDNKQINYSYAPVGNLLQVIDWAGRTTQYEYDANGRLVKTTRPDGSVEIREYDNNSCLTKLYDVDCDNEYDFEYDELSNITAESNNNSQSAVNTAQAAMTVTSDNRLATWNGETVTYDADGNMTCGPLNGNMTAYTFDCRNRLTAVGNTYYRYDAENNRIAVIQNGAITRYVINPNAALSRVLMKTDPDATVTCYVYGLGLIGEETAGSYINYHYDLRGSTVALTDNNGDVTDSFQYGVYGEVERTTGSTATPFLYNGRDGVITDANGLYYMRARYYSPEIMRFIRQDDLVGSITDPLSLNRYAYVKGNPVSGIDPRGNEDVIVVNYVEDYLGGTVVWDPDTSFVTITFPDGSSRTYYGPDYVNPYDNRMHMDDNQLCSDLNYVWDATKVTGRGYGQDSAEWWAVKNFLNPVHEWETQLEGCNEVMKTGTSEPLWTSPIGLNP